MLFAASQHVSDLVPGGPGVIDRIIIVFCYQREPLFGAEIAFQVAKLSKITSLSFISVMQDTNMQDAGLGAFIYPIVIIVS